MVTCPFKSFNIYQMAGLYKSLEKYWEALELDFGPPTRLVTLPFISFLSKEIGR